MIYSSDYRHPLEEAIRGELERVLAFEELLTKYYEEVLFSQRRIECLGKTVQVTENQFPAIYELLQEISAQFDVPTPPLFIYEDFYYGAETEGCSTPWIEVSSKTVRDFDREELAFILARQVARIQLGHLKTRVTIELFNELALGRLGAVLGGISLGLSSTALTTLRLSAKKWFRISNISMDCAAYLVVGSISTASRAILMEVLNSKELAQEVSVKAFLNQSKDMDVNQDVFSLLAHYDQEVPFAPYRIKELLRFASSDRAKAYCKKSKM
ncbi:MAG: M48 family metallopeptidase [Firmicutes bacterium]|nr:M48 family metallopeptidase [Bacillota bacterium]